MSYIEMKISLLNSESDSSKKRATGMIGKGNSMRIMNKDANRI